MKLIFETTENFDGTPLDKPHRTTRKVDGVVFEYRYDGHDHTDLVVRNATTRRIIGSLWEVGAEWIVGQYFYATLRIEDT